MNINIIHPQSNVGCTLIERICYYFNNQMLNLYSSVFTKTPECFFIFKKPRTTNGFKRVSKKKKMFCVIYTHSK